MKQTMPELEQKVEQPACPLVSKGFDSRRLGSWLHQFWPAIIYILVSGQVHLVRKIIVPHETPLFIAQDRFHLSC